MPTLAALSAAAFTPAFPALSVRCWHEWIGKQPAQHKTTQLITRATLIALLLHLDTTRYTVRLRSVRSVGGGITDSITLQPADPLDDIPSFIVTPRSAVIDLVGNATFETWERGKCVHGTRHANWPELIDALTANPIAVSGRPLPFSGRVSH